MKRLVLSLLVFLLISSATQASDTFKLGLENIPAAFIQNIKGGSYRVGLITNQTGRDRAGKRNVDLLLEHGIPVAKVFAPEHGFSGTVQAEKEVKNEKDQMTNIPVVSLYGAGTGRQITQEHIGDVDMLIFDIQDSGMRHYTYISTLLHAMQAAAEHNKQFVVLDRPNPLGWNMEGPLVDSQIQNVKSFIAAAPIPLRHGMTIGELAWFYNKFVLEKPAKLHVVKMQNYDRRAGLSVCPMIGLSPNLQTKESCHGYSFLGLLGEVRPFDVGVRTEKAFQTIMLPDHMFKPDQWKKLEALLARFGIQSSSLMKREKGKKLYHGFHLEIADINAVSSFSIFVSLLRFFKAEGIPLTFSEFFDRAVGTDFVRNHIAGLHDPLHFATKINADLESFFAKAQDCFMYEPFPKVVPIEHF